MQKVRKIFDIISMVIMVILLIFSSIYILFYKTAEVNGVSMYPTYNDGDFVIVKKSIKNLKNFDNIVIYSESLDKKLCKRVIGLPKDTIDIVNSKLIVNNELIKEDYINETVWGSSEVISEIVKDDEVYVMGDNRNDSLDSRLLGALKIEDIDGIIVYDMTKELGITKKEFKRILVVLMLILIIELLLNNRSTKKSDKEYIKDNNE